MQSNKTGRVMTKKDKFKKRMKPGKMAGLPPRNQIDSIAKKFGLNPMQYMAALFGRRGKRVV